MRPLPEPLLSTDPVDWLVYADSLYEAGLPERVAELARRVAQALSPSPPPRLVLVASVRRARFRFFGLELGRREELVAIQPGAAVNWPELINPRWWTPRAAARRFTGRPTPAAPADFPGLLEHCPNVARAFFRRVARGGKRDAGEGGAGLS
jgi:hypothetical protein